MRKYLILVALVVPAIAFADPAYSLKIDAPAAKKAQRGVVKIHIAPGTGYHMNKDYPTKMMVSPPAGASVEKPKQTAKDATKFEEAGADFEVVYTSTAAGKQTFTGELSFAVCTATTCDPKKEKLSFTVDVN
jgi:hypothetical protein